MQKATIFRMLLQKPSSKIAPEFVPFCHGRIRRFCLLSPGKRENPGKILISNLSWANGTKSTFLLDLKNSPLKTFSEQKIAVADESANPP
uniref:Uncharacterized protein n=1 Tax=Romanomermis culicivorax TaxID=13658 RepID=A0A915K4Y2_ROMCU